MYWLLHSSTLCWVRFTLARQIIPRKWMAKSQWSREIASIGKSIYCNGSTSFSGHTPSFVWSGFELQSARNTTFPKRIAMDAKTKSVFFAAPAFRPSKLLTRRPIMKTKRHTSSPKLDWRTSLHHKQFWCRVERRGEHDYYRGSKCLYDGCKRSSTFVGSQVREDRCWSVN